MNKHRWGRVLRPNAIAAVWWGLAGGVSLAQSPPSLPLGAPDTFELDRQQRESLRQQRERQLLLTPAPRALPEPAKSEPLAESDARFTLRQVDFSPSALLDVAQLRELAAPFIGQTVSFKDLGQIVERVNALYIERNQVFARAVLPPQRVAEGRVRIELVEAKLDGLSLVGRERITQEWLQEVLRVAPGDLLDSDALDERIQRFHRASEARLALTAQPGTQPSSTALQLQVTEPSPWSGSVSLTNEGNDSTGRNQVLADLRWFSPLGRGDRALLSLSASQGARSMNLSWAVPLSARWGTRLQTSLSRSRTHVINGPFAAFDIRGESAQESLSLGQPVWISGPWALDAQWGWTRSKSENLFAGVGLGATRLHQSSLSFTTSYRNGPHDGSAFVGWLHGSAKAASGLKTQDSKLQWGGSYLYRMPEKSSLVLVRLNGQSARGATPLGSQSFSLGGPSTLRAFSSGTLSDASGYTLGGEFHHALTSTLGVQLFAEKGDVWGAGGRAGLQDWGVAAEWRLSKTASLNVTSARIMGPVPAGQGRVRNYLRLSASF